MRANFRSTHHPFMLLLDFLMVIHKKKRMVHHFPHKGLHFTNHDQEYVNHWKIHAHYTKDDAPSEPACHKNFLIICYLLFKVIL